MRKFSENLISGKLSFQRKVENISIGHSWLLSNFYAQKTNYPPFWIATLHKKTKKKYRYYRYFVAKVSIVSVPNFFNTCHHYYSPDLAPCDFWLFPQLKDELRGQHFKTTQEYITAAQMFFNSFSADDFEKTFTKWQDCMRSCLAATGAYFEKDVQTLNLTDESE